MTGKYIGGRALLCARSRVKVFYSLFFTFTIIFSSGILQSSMFNDTQSGKTVMAIDNEIIVKYKSSVTPENRASIYNALSYVSSTSSQALLSADLVKISSSQDLESTLKYFNERPDVEYVQPNYLYDIPHETKIPRTPMAAIAPNDTFFPLQQTPFNLMKIPDTWSITRGDPSILIALVGTGINHNHPDLGGGFGPGFRVVGGYDFVNNNAFPDDAYGYTTLSASIIGAITNNSKGIAGVMWDVRFLDCKNYQDSSHIANSWSTASAINYAIQKSANIIQIDTQQIGNQIDPTVSEALNKAIALGIPIITYSGWDGSSTTVRFPCAFSNTICVGSTDLTDKPYSASNQGPQVLVAAPDFGIAAATGTNYVAVIGPNISCSYVTGICGLLQAVRYRLGIQSLINILTSTTDDPWNFGLNLATGYGRVNALKAVQKAQTLYSPDALSDTVPMPNPLIIGHVPSVTFSIPNGLSNSGLSVSIYDMTGTLIRTISGSNVWDGRNDSSQYVASGVYFYNLNTNSGSANGKLTLIR